MQEYSKWNTRVSQEMQCHLHKVFHWSCYDHVCCCCCCCHFFLGKKVKSIGKAIQVEKISKLICNIDKKKGIVVLVDDALLHGVKFVSISPQTAQGLKLNIAICPFSKPLAHSQSSNAIKNMTDDF